MCSGVFDVSATNTVSQCRLEEAFWNKSAKGSCKPFASSSDGWDVSEAEEVRQGSVRPAGSWELISVDLIFHLSWWKKILEGHSLSE